MIPPAIILLELAGRFTVSCPLTNSTILGGIHKRGIPQLAFTFTHLADALNLEPNTSRTLYEETREAKCTVAQMFIATSQSLPPPSLSDAFEL